MVDCDAHPNNSACEKPVSSMLKTIVPICIFAFIFMGAGIVFFCVMRKRRIQDRLAEERAAAKYRDLGFDDDEPVGRKGPRAPAGPKNNNRASMGPATDPAFSYEANPNMYLRNEGSTYKLSQLHPSLEGQQTPTKNKEFV
ncbi:uncharacterized protein BKCO1_2600012 [Diplodia corticola]|uniref:Uncharacterized protein n=1 Tax=Diplodia corticola TaxID=236234 RepID=A0A1J9R058_9PEZI|nr:uncharacterized protein BKCO1_2600012 [Diplodia corticola]OJD33993.1 hypothetical protein BKCO1_2600012 [Diplodia corticola]